MNRGRNTRGSALANANKNPFVSGGVLTDFTGSANVASPVLPLPSANITVKIEENVLIRNGNNKVLQPELENMESSVAKGDDADSDGAGPKKKWIRKPLNKKAKRLRQNRRLRKLLIPKNALMSLHELMGSSISEYRVMPEERGFVAQVLVNNIQYEGRGTSKIAAKNNASEKALRDLVIQKMVQVPKATINLNAALSVDGTAAEGEVEDTEMTEEAETKEEPTAEVPMMHLASFALHKLFSEWQAEGFEIPDFKTGGPAIATDILDAEALPLAPPPPVIKTAVPENANAMHPTTLLCMMRPGTKYVDLGAEGKSPAIVHSVGVEVDGRQFIGRAKNKKLARKLAARDACNALFGTQYPLEECELTGPNQQMVQ